MGAQRGSVEFGVLGAVRVRGDDGVPRGIPAPRQRTLLAALLLSAGHAVSADMLAEHVWDASPPPGARGTLHTYVMRLRNRLGPEAGRRIKASPPGYLIDVTDESDLYRFDALRNAGAAAMAARDWERASASLGTALELWRGEPLTDVTSETLKRAEGPRLSESRLRVSEQWTQAQLHLGRGHDALPELTRLAADHPYREELHAQLMMALYQTGRRADALAVFRDARHRFVEEFGLEPGPQLRAAHAKILADEETLLPRASAMPVTISASASAATDPPPVPVRVPVTPVMPGVPGVPGMPGVPGVPGVPGYPLPRQLPADVPDFTGREEHVGRLTALLARPGDGAQPTAPVAAVTGCAGIGKTALAVHVAHLTSSRFPDGQLYASLLDADGEPVAAADVLAGFLRALGVADSLLPECEEERAARYRTILADRRVLVVLDDARDAAQVRPLLPGAGSSGVIVTSRQKLTGLSGARLFVLDVLSHADAAQLLARIAGADRVRAEPDATASLVEKCGGHPLAICIAAARLAGNPAWQIGAFDQLLGSAGDRRTLDEFTAGDLALRSCFDRSYHSLSRRPGSRDRGPNLLARTFRLLGLADMPVLGTAAVAALTDSTEASSATALAALADMHLVESPAPGRYRLHCLLRAYAAERTCEEESPDERTAAMRRLLAWYLRMAFSAARAVDPVPRQPTGSPGQSSAAFAGPGQALDWFDRERPNLAAAIEHAASRGMHDIAARLAAAMRVLLVRGARAGDWPRSQKTGLASAGEFGDEEPTRRPLGRPGHDHASGHLSRAHQSFQTAPRVRMRTCGVP